LLGGYPPFYAEGNDTRPLFTAICKGQYEFHDDAWHDVSKEAKEFVASMLQVDPKKRATLDQVLAHPYILHYNARPTAHRSTAVSKLKSFNARRRLRAAAKVRDETFANNH
jgi:calcium-dependent protein kinase